MTNCITAIIGFIGVIIGVSITEIRLWRERKERYQVISFEKRLEVHQQAFAFCMKIANLLGQSYGRISDEEANMHAMILDELYREANEWWGNSCLYLDKDSRISMFNAIGLPLDRAEQLIKNKRGTGKLRQQARNTIRETIRHITKGIGSGYLPDIDREFKKSIISKK